MTTAQPTHSRKESLDGASLRDMFASGVAWLESQSEYVNSLNVFPVPDGDTGTNLLLTMRSAAAEAARTQSDSASGIAAALAKGALLGTRGNAGVIFSQIMRGLHQGVAGKDRLRGEDLPLAFREATSHAYKAVGKPVEGTILTVVREIAEALERSDVTDRSLPAMFALAVTTAKASVLRTPDLMPLLKENGVVDSGAQGLAIILEGMAHYVDGDPYVPAPKASVLTQNAHATELPQFEGQRYGYCTEFFIEMTLVETEAIRAEFEASALSVIVAGDRDLIKVHLHTLDPDAFLARARVLGTLGATKVEDMDAQHRDWRRKRSIGPATGKTSVVAVAAGEGLQELLRSLGVAEIVQGGQTMNPSAQEILDAILAVPAAEVIVLPNNKNVVMAANQAKELAAGKHVIVVPTENVPEGISAMIGFNYERDAKQNAAAMEDARSQVRTGELSWAVRATMLGGRPVAVGEAIGLQRDRVVVADPDMNRALESLLSFLGVENGSTVTLYYGADVTLDRAGEAKRRIQRLFPDAEVQTFAGGQPHYYYFVAVE